MKRRRFAAKVFQSADRTGWPAVLPVAQAAGADVV
jgi:hypothetical protein